MSDFAPHLEEPAVRALLDRLVDLLDRTPLAERSRPPGFRVNPRELPIFFAIEDAQDRRLVWRFIEQLRDAGWIQIAGKRHGAGQAPWEVSPRLTLVPQAEGAVRAALGREFVETPYARQWREAVLAAAPRFAGDARPISRTPIEVPDAAPEQIIDRICKMADLAPGTLTREASARYLWGLSKLLDNRLDAINAALGRAVLREKPLLVNVHVPSDALREVLFIENEVSYLMAIAACPAWRALVWSSGFMASARRLREHGGMTIHATAASARDGLFRLEMLLQGAEELPFAFFGDLDYAGMRILRQLRESFPSMSAWHAGYRALLHQLERGDGHSPGAGDKAGQIDPGATGCMYADGTILPAIRALGKFVDQEGYSWID
ncbi:MAG: DUF2220 family protein [Gammaproteobacteria bacterium]